MSLSLGVARINSVVRWFAYLSIGFAAVACLYAWAEPKESAPSLVVAGLMCFLGGAALLLAWIVDGFLGRGQRQDTVATTPAQVTQRWGIILGSITIGAFVVAREGGAYAVGQYFGQALGALCLIALVVAIATLNQPARRGVSKGGAIAFGLIALIWAVKSHVDSVTTRVEAKEGLSQIREALERAQAQAKAQGSDDRTNPVSEKSPVHVSATNIVGDDFSLQAAMAYVADSTNRQAKTDKRYIDAIANLQIERWLSQEALTNKALRSSLRPLIASGLSALKQYERDAMALQADALAYGDRIGRRGPQGIRFNEGVRESSKKATAILRLSIDTERSFYQIVPRVYDFLDSRSVGVEQGQPLFKTEEDLNAFRKHLAEVQRIATLSEAAMKQANDMQADRIKKLRDLENKLSGPAAK